MNRLFKVVGVAALLLFVGWAMPNFVENTQFEGYVTSMGNGQPMPIGTPVRVYLGGVLQDETIVEQSNGYYRITGENEDFPTGTYQLISDNGYAYGVTLCSHTEANISSCNRLTVSWNSILMKVLAHGSQHLELQHPNRALLNVAGNTAVCQLLNLPSRNNWPAFMGQLFRCAPGGV